MSKATYKKNHNTDLIGYPETTIVIATLLLSSLYTIATTDKTSKQIQVVCAVMVIISSFVAIFCNRNDKKDVANQTNAVGTSSNVANASTQTDDTQISVADNNIHTEISPEMSTQTEENMQENTTAQQEVTQDFMGELNKKIQNRRTDDTTPSQAKPQASNKNAQAT